MKKTTRLMEGESIHNGKLHIKESYVVKPSIVEEAAKGIMKEYEGEGEHPRIMLKPRIEAIHAGRTKNNNIYPAEKLRGDRVFRDANGSISPTGVYSFTLPYPKPMILDHETYDMENCTGRITNAQFIKDSLTNKEMIVIIPEITDEDAIERVLDGRYLTVSVGASTDAAICNVCGKDIINDGWCEHEKGQDYDGIICGWIVGNLWFDECSWVTVPADSYAMVVDKGEVIVMDTYMGVGNEFYDLSSRKEFSLLTESAANTLGLFAEKEPEGGFDKMPKNAVIEEEKEKAQTTEEVSTPEPEMATVETEVEKTQDESTVDSAQLAEKDAIIAEKDNQIAVLQTEKAELEEQIAALVAKETELVTEKQSLMDQYSEAMASAHIDLVEKIVDLKIGLGKPGIDNREEAIANHMERSNESLKDSYADLMVEFKSVKKQYIAEKVSNPGVGTVPGEPNSVIEGAQNSVPAELDTEQILKSLLVGFRKNK